MPQPKKPKLGQNFLADDAARHRIADALGDISQRTVVEIGPGHGAISDLLATRARRLILIELDRALAAELRFRYRDKPHIEVHEADVLRTGLNQFAPEGTLDIVGNLPYYITSDILLHLFAHCGVIARAVLMMQREVADRVTAAPGVSDYSMLSATTALYARAESLFTLPPSAFSPPPDVFSTVVRLQMAPQFAALGITPETFIAFLRQAFAQKRKTLANNLRNAGYTLAAWPPDVPPQARAEAVPLAAMARLYLALSMPAASQPAPNRDEPTTLT